MQEIIPNKLGIKMAQRIVELEDQEELRKLAERIALGMCEKGAVPAEELLSKRDELMLDKKATLLTKEAALDMVRGNDLSIFTDSELSSTDEEISKLGGRGASDARIQHALQQFAGKVSHII